MAFEKICVLLFFTSISYAMPIKEETNFVCPSESSNVIIWFPYEEDCHKFWECWDGIPFLRSCPPDEFWNGKLNTCDSISDYCLYTSVPTEPTQTTEHPTKQTSVKPTNKPTEAPSPGGNPPICPSNSTDEIVWFPNESDCSKYWECWDGEAYLRPCPAGEFWNAKLNTCDTSSEFCFVTSSPTDISTQSTRATELSTKQTSVQPTDRPTQRPSTDPPTEQTSAKPTDRSTIPPSSGGNPPICPSNSTDEIIWFPNESDCSKYWECWDGEAYLRPCPAGEFWNVKLNTCDTSSEYCFKLSSTTEIPTKRSSKQTTEFIESTLSTTIKSTRKPDISTTTDDSIETSIVPTTITTRKPQIITTTHSSKPHRPYCPADDRDEILLFPYEGDCSKFWECWNGVLLEKSCLDGEWWYQNERRCDIAGTYCDQ